MEKSKSERKRCAEKQPLNVTGQLAMPSVIRSWERDLLAVLIEAVGGRACQGAQADREVRS